MVKASLRTDLGRTFMFLLLLFSPFLGISYLAASLLHGPVLQVSAHQPCFMHVEMVTFL